MLNKKKRRHSGWTTPISTIKDKKENIINNCIEPQPFYDDWNNYRDGQRDYMKDKTKKKKFLVLKKLESFDNENYDIFKSNRWKIIKQKKIRRVRKS